MTDIIKTSRDWVGSECSSVLGKQEFGVLNRLQTSSAVIDDSLSYPAFCATPRRATCFDVILHPMQAVTPNGNGESPTSWFIITLQPTLLFPNPMKVHMARISTRISDAFPFSFFVVSE